MQERSKLPCISANFASPPTPSNSSPQGKQEIGVDSQDDDDEEEDDEDNDDSNAKLFCAEEFEGVQWVLEEGHDDSNACHWDGKLLEEKMATHWSE